MCIRDSLYCSFSSSPIGIWKDQVDAYLDALCKEIDYASEAFADKELNTVYIGGGTPTTLEPAQLDRLLTKLEERFDYSRLREFTVEAGRPDSITAVSYTHLFKGRLRKAAQNIVSDHDNPVAKCS